MVRILKRPPLRDPEQPPPEKPQQRQETIEQAEDRLLDGIERTTDGIRTLEEQRLRSILQARALGISFRRLAWAADASPQTIKDWVDRAEGRPGRPPRR